MSIRKNYKLWPTNFIHSVISDKHDTKAIYGMISYLVDVRFTWGPSLFAFATISHILVGRLFQVISPEGLHGQIEAPFIFKRGMNDHPLTAGRGEDNF